MGYWAGLGMNYGHQATHNPYNAIQVAADFAFLRSMGVAKLRIAYPTFDAGGIPALQWLVQTALAAGFYVIWGATSSAGTPVTATRWASFKSYVQTTLAPWAQAQNTAQLELAVGNEEEFHCDGTTLTVSTVVSDLAALATNVQVIYTAGAISYQSPIAFITNWSANGLGGLDRIGFNAYSLGAGIKTHANNIVAHFPNNGYLSEWGTPNGFNDFGNEQFFANVTQTQVNALKTVGIDAYYFCYRDGSFGLPANAWAIKTTTDNFRLAAPKLFGVRSWFAGNPNASVSRTGQRARAPTQARTATPHRQT